MLLDLEDQVTIQARLHFFDLSILLLGADPWAMKEVRRWFPDAPGSPRSDAPAPPPSDASSSPPDGEEIRWIVATLDAWPAWKDFLGRIPPASRPGRFPGEALYLHEDAAIVVEPEIGLVVRSARGDVTVLIAPRAEGRGEEAFRDYTPMISVLLQDALCRSGGIMAHAGAVGMQRQCLLWTGAGGAGKTTQVMRAVARGCDFYGDDIIFLKESDGQWIVHPYWRPIQFTRDTAKLVPFLADREAGQGAKGKQSLFVDALALGTPPPPGVLKAVACLSDDPRPRKERLDVAQAISALCGNLLSYLWPGDAAGALDRVCRLASEVPVFRVSHGWLDAGGDEGWWRA